MKRNGLELTLAILLGLSALICATRTLAASNPTASPTPGTALSCDLTATFPGIECRQLALRAAIDGLRTAGSTRPKFNDLLIRQLTRIQFQTTKAERLIAQRQRARGKSWLGAALTTTISLEHRLNTTGTRVLTPIQQQTLLDMASPLRRALTDLHKTL